MPSGKPITGQTAIAGARTQIVPAASIPQGKTPRSVIITAMAGNSAVVYIGDDAVLTTTGDQLATGQKVAIDTVDVCALYVTGTVADKVSFLVVTN